MAQLTLIDEGDSRPDDEMPDQIADDHERIGVAGFLLDATDEAIERALRAYDAGAELQTAIAGMEQS